METYSLETTISNNGTLIIKGLPFKIGDKVKVIVQICEHKQEQDNLYPLRGTPFNYIKPFESVAGKEWEVLK